MIRQNLECPYCKGELEEWVNDYHCLKCDTVFSKCVFQSMCPSTWTTTATENIKVVFENDQEIEQDDEFDCITC